MAIHVLANATDFVTHRSGPVCQLLDYVMKVWAPQLVPAFRPLRYHDAKGRPCAVNLGYGGPRRQYHSIVVDGRLGGIGGRWCSVAVEAYRCEGGKRSGLLFVYQGPTYCPSWKWQVHDYNDASPTYSPLAGVYD
jgi:hypothetical protein